MSELRRGYGIFSIQVCKKILDSFYLLQRWISMPDNRIGLFISYEPMAPLFHFSLLCATDNSQCSSGEKAKI